MRTLNPWDQQYPLGSTRIDSLVIVALGGFGDSVLCALASRAFFATGDLPVQPARYWSPPISCLWKRWQLFYGRLLPLALDCQMPLTHLWFHGQAGRY